MNGYSRDAINTVYLTPRNNTTLTFETRALRIAFLFIQTNNQQTKCIFEEKHFFVEEQRAYQQSKIQVLISSMNFTRQYFMQQLMVTVGLQ